MRPQTIQGVLRRRMLVNFRVEPRIIQRMLPPKFRPKLFADEKTFPVGSSCLDCALLMRDIEHEWQTAPALTV